MPTLLETNAGPLTETFFSQGGQLTVGSCDLQIRPIDRNGDPTTADWSRVGRYDTEGLTLKAEIEWGNYMDDAGNEKTWAKKVKWTINFPSSQLASEIWFLMFRIMLERIADESDPNLTSGIALVNPAGRLTDDFAFELRAIQRVDGVPTADSFRTLHLYYVVPESGLEINKNTEPAKINVQLAARPAVNRKTPNGAELYGFIGTMVYAPILRLYQTGVIVENGSTINFGGPHAVIQERPIDVINDGSADLTVSAMNLTGADAAHFEVLNPDDTLVGYPITIPRGDSVALKLRFGIATPAAGPATAALEIVSNAQSFAADLSGQWAA